MTTNHGAVAQLVERFVRIEEVVVSITISSTNPPEFHLRRIFLFPAIPFGVDGARMGPG